MNHVLPPPSPASLSVVGRAERYAVRRIYCVGQNYAEHSREMGSDPEKVPPFFFTKPADAVYEPALQGAMPFPA
jgi:fumarylpyruvate hydrolase